MEQNIEERNKRPFGKRDIIGYFFGDFGCNMSFSLQAAWLFIFYTQYIGITLEHWAIIILITKIFDGINDPIAGFIIDKIGARTSGDKFKPWIKFGGPILAVVPVLMFIDSSAWSYALRITICFVSYLAWDLAYTIVNVPYGALSSVMTTDAVQRTQLSTARSYGGLLGGTTLGIIIPLFVYRDTVVDGNTINVFVGENMFTIAIILGVIAFISFMILYYNVEERVVTEVELDEEGEVVETGFVDTLKALSQNRPFWGLMVAAVGQILFLMGANQLYQLTLQMYYNDGSLGSYLQLMNLAPMLFGGVFGSQLVKHYGKKEVSANPMLISMGIMVVLLIVPIENPYVFLAALIVANTFAFGMILYIWAMVADAIDYQEYITGTRNEGSVYALYSMGRKIMQGFSSSLVPYAMTIVAPALVASDPSTWTPQSDLAIKNLGAIFAILGYFISFIGLRFIFNLDKDTLADMNEELAERRGEEETTDDSDLEPVEA